MKSIETEPKQFSHEAEYRGKGYRDKLKRLVTICGAGALGSNLCESLVRVGFSNLRVIDHDRIEEKNTGNQSYGVHEAGGLKTNTLKANIFRALQVEIDAQPKRLEEGTIKKLLKNSDLVCDVFDNSASRQLVHDFCSQNDIPCLHAGLFEGYGEVIWDLWYKVPKDVGGEAPCDYPLARNIVMLTVSIITEEIMDFFLNKKLPRRKNWSVTLDDLQIKEMSWK